MNIGVVSRSFPNLTNREIAEFMSSNGFRSIELCFSSIDAKYWVYNGRSDLSTLTDERASELVENFRIRGIEVVSIGVFTNLMEPDDEERERNLYYFEEHMKIASQNRVPYVATECGFIRGRRGVQADTYESDFQRLLESVKWLTLKAEKYGVYIALEPCVLDVIPSAKRMLNFIEQVGSDRIKVLLDPANLIANSSEEDMFRYLAPHIAYFHGKDRKVNDTYGRVIGDGDINWPLFLNLYHRYTDEIPFILEYVNIDNVCQIRDRVVEADRKGGKINE